MSHRSPLKQFFFLILPVGLFVGTLDITAAVIQTLIYGRDPMRMLRFIASAVFGDRAFSEAPNYPFYGLAFHYLIALGWTLIFFWLYPRFKRLFGNRIVIGVLYGIMVWAIMNLIVLPLSAAPKIPFNPRSSLIAALVLIVAIGLPLSHLAHLYFKPRKES